jgi:site-specific DNA recombinase
MYANGTGPRTIAATLNAEGVPSPGSQWKRDTRRQDGKWLASAIHGDINRGSGILNNDSYRGMVIWNRSRWIRSAADSANRRAVMNPRSEWIEQADESLRIVSDELWQRVKARQARQSRELGSKVKGALRQRVRPTKYLLSGLLRCQACESSFAMSNGERYQCSSHHNGGTHACDVSLSVPRDRIERVMLDCAYSELLDDKKLRKIETQQTVPAAVDYRPMIAQLERQIANYLKAIAAGADGLADVVNALRAARSDLDLLKELTNTPRPAARLTVESVMKRAKRMRELIAQGGEFAQQAMRELFPGSIWLARDPNGGHLWAYAQGALSDVVVESGALVAPTAAFPLVHNYQVGEARGRAGRIPKVDVRSGT